MSIEAATFGTLARDAELKTSSKGKPYLRATIAVVEGESTAWVSLMIFDQAAIDNAAKLVKGARLYVEGRLQLSEWTDRDGKPRHGLSIMSWHCRLSAIGRNRSKKRDDRSGREEPKRQAPVSSAGGRAFDDSIPFAQEWRA